MIEEYGVEEYLLDIQEDLQNKKYKPKPVKRVYISKPDVKQRPLGIPTIRDRIVQQACKMVIEPVFEAKFQDSSYGFRPKRDAKQATERVKKELYKNWYVVDADGCTLGRLASEIAKILRGKNKPQFTPHEDTGDYVIVVNAEKVKVTGKKMSQKIYYHHSGYVGGMKETTLNEMLAKKPERVLELAVKGMLPKGPLGRQMYRKLFVYTGPEHKHAAQKPEQITF